MKKNIRVEDYIKIIHVLLINYDCCLVNLAIPFEIADSGPIELCFAAFGVKMLGILSKEPFF